MVENSLYEFPNQLPSDLGNPQRSQVLYLPNRNKTFANAIKSYTKADIKFFWPYRILLRSKYFVQYWNYHVVISNKCNLTLSRDVRPFIAQTAH